MATTQKQASIARSVGFSKRGLGYTAYLHASTGDFVQQYDDDGNYIPNITPTAPVRLTLTVTSSRQAGTVTPDSVKYTFAGVELTFDSSGSCTTSGLGSYFKKDGADLLVIGNIADYLNKVSSFIEVLAKKDGDDIYANCNVEISKYSGGIAKKVSIAPADSKNFTLTSQTDSVMLKAGVLGRTGWIYNSPQYKYHWQIADAAETSGWRTLSLLNGPTGGTITLDADDVNTYANIRCTVYRANTPDSSILGTAMFSSMPVGSDCVGVLDASDPLDIICSVKINKTGTGTEVDAEVEELDDTMPDTAYLIYTLTLVSRGGTTSIGTTTWLNGILTDPAGITTRTIIPSGGKYKVFKSDISSAYGQHTLVMTGQLA